MKQYQIYVHPEGNYEAVKQGWSWPAFFFSSIWAIVERLWIPVAVYYLAMIVFVWTFMYLEIPIEDGQAFTFIASAIFGINASIWKGKNLMKRGYELKKTVTSSDSEHAIRVYVKELGESK